jgi:glutathione S-transferase
VDEVFASPSFMPSSPLLRAKSRIWIDYCDDYFIDDHYALLKNQETARHPVLLEKASRNFMFIEEKGLAELGGSGPYWLGAEVSLVDFAWYPFFERLPAWSYYRGLQIPESCHRLKAWIAAMAARSSVRQIMNDREYYIEHYLGYAKQVLSA